MLSALMNAQDQAPFLSIETRKVRAQGYRDVTSGRRRQALQRRGREDVVVLDGAGGDLLAVLAARGLVGEAVLWDGLVYFRCADRHVEH